ncbi:MAG: ATP-binding protein, partial [Lactobacillus iners]|nr:ATP-binding protein [Lactobacillus iners]
MRLSVSGKIIKEISEKIPSTTYSMVELIKNAYEAMASYIEINIYDEMIEIIDDGEGMDLSDIRDLLIVSHSNKEYGVIKNGRIISGEKGLGFFSVFKFGSKVTVHTSKQELDYSFSIDMNEIENLKDIYDSNVDISKSASVDVKKHGTKIVIENLNSETMEIFCKVLNNPSNFLKLQNSIIDDSFEIKLNNLMKNSKNINSDISNLSLKNKIIAEAFFDSDKNYANDCFYYRICINNSWYDIDYFNNVYFSNELYNVEVNSSMRSSKVIRQQVGIINVFLMEKGILDFNSDRTMLIESKNQLLFQDFLNYISSDSQVRIKEIEELEIQQKPKNRNIKMLKGESLKDNEIDDTNIRTIYYQNNVEKIFNSIKIGDWKIEYNNGDTTNISVLDYPDAKMRFILNELEVAKEYRLDDILEATDCKGTKQIIPQHIDIQPAKNVSFDSKNEKL